MNKLFALKQKPILFFTVLYLPAILIVFQSYFKSSLLGLPELGMNYWAIRIVLIALFIFLLFRIASGEDFNPSTINSIDRYQHLRNKQDPLLGLRALACLNVFMGHWFLNVFYPTISLAAPYDAIVRTLLSFSPWAGVWIFFTLSGYLMGKGFVTRRHNLTSKGIKKFYIHRIRRIFPIYFSAIFFVAVLINPETLDFRNKLMIKEFLEYSLFDLNGLRGSNGILWSLSTEVQFYLIVPFLYLIISLLFTSTKKLLLFSISTCVTLVCLRFMILRGDVPWQQEMLHWHDRVYMPLLTNLDCFLVGTVTSIIVNNCRKGAIYLKNGMYYGLASVILMQIILTCWSYPAIVLFSEFRVFMSFAPAITALCTALCIFFFEISELTSNNRKIFWSVISFAGAITYCFYVWHWPIIHSLRKLFPVELTIINSIKILPFAFVITLLVSYLFYKFIEQYYGKNNTKDREDFFAATTVG